MYGEDIDCGSRQGPFQFARVVRYFSHEMAEQKLVRPMRGMQLIIKVFPMVTFPHTNTIIFLGLL